MQTEQSGMPCWDITVPSRRRLRGISMAAFTGSSPAAVEIPIIPFPALTLFIDLGDAAVVDRVGRERARGMGIVGVGAVGLRGRSQNLDCLQIRIAPPLAYRVFGGILPEIADDAVGLDAIWGPDVERLRDQLRTHARWSSRAAVVETILSKRIHVGSQLDPEIVRAWSLLTGTAGRVRVGHLADAVGWSRKRLWHRFRDHLGMTPKQAGQLIRFDRAAYHLAAGQGPAQVAANTGYADQSHLHRDTTTFAGLTPTEVATAPWLRADQSAWPRSHLLNTHVELD